MNPELVAHSSGLERDLYFMSVSEAGSFPEEISLPAKNFSVFLALDATGLNVTSISGIVDPLLRAGAVYFCCYGPDCERVHDIIDEETLYAKLDQEADDSVIMTTWHDDVILSDALEFFVFDSVPDEKYIAACKAGLAISFVNPTWDGQIVEGLKQLTKS